MPRTTTTYSVLLISPSDVEAERDALTDLANQWNAQAGRSLNAQIDLVRWEFHATPDLSAHPQQVINSQMVDNCDLGIAVFWHRVGTPTPNHPSGSVEEIYRLLEKGVRVMAYFCERDIPQAALNDEQYERLKEVRTRLRSEGLVASYRDISQLREKVNLHLTRLITEIATQQQAEPGDMTAITSAAEITPKVSPVDLTFKVVEITGNSRHPTWELWIWATNTGGEPMHYVECEITLPWVMLNNEDLRFIQGQMEGKETYTKHLENTKREIIGGKSGITSQGNSFVPTYTPQYGDARNVPILPSGDFFWKIDLSDGFPDVEKPDFQIHWRFLSDRGLPAEGTVFLHEIERKQRKKDF